MSRKVYFSKAIFFSLGAFERCYKYELMYHRVNYKIHPYNLGLLEFYTLKF